jgi:Zn-dependent protease with chaperone function
MNILDFFKSSKTLNQHNAPGFMGSITELCEKAGARIPKSIRLAKMPMPNAAYHPATDTLFVTEGILEMMGSRDLHRPASREMKAVLAHELGHVKFVKSQIGPIIGMSIAGPLVALATSYLLEKTYDRVKTGKKEDPQNPTHFWDEFTHVTKEAADGGWKSFKDFASYLYPTYSKTLRAERYKDESWAKTLFHEAKIAAIGTLALIPTFAACRPIALHNEWQSDRFMLALTQDKEASLSAFRKLAAYSEKTLHERASTPIQRSFAQKISRALQSFMANTIMAHPELADRIKFIERANPAELARSFHL